MWLGDLRLAFFCSFGLWFGCYDLPYFMRPPVSMLELL